MKTLHLFVAGLLVILAACAARGPARGGDVSALLRSEKAFGELAVQKGTRTAFLAYLAEGSILFRPGPVDARAWYAGRPESPGILSWEPAYAEMAGACDLGYTTGPWEFRKGGSREEPVAFGDYVTIWRRLPDGAWKVAVDTGIQHQKPSARIMPSPDLDGGDRVCTEPPKPADTQAEIDSLIREDAVFSEDSAARGVKAAFQSRGAEEIRLLREDAFPIVGLKAALALLGSVGGTLTWKPAGAAVSASRDLGYTYGLTKLVTGEGSSPSEEGAYLRVWRRDPEGRWKVVLDWACRCRHPKALERAWRGGGAGVSPVAHALLGWLAAAAPRGLSRRDRALVTAAAVVPDLDGLGAVVEIATRDSQTPLLWFTEYHHALHTALFAVVLAGLAFAFARRRWLTASLALLSVHLHLLCDILGGRGPDGYSWPVPYLAPFSSGWQLEWSGQWALNAWPNFAITGAALFLTFFLAWDRGYSPVGLFSERADRAFVETLRRRFPKREGGITMAWLTAANVKRAAAVLLFVALFLPLSRCARQAPAGPEGQPQAQAPVEYEYSYAWTRFDAGNIGSYLAILSFLWPLPILLYEAFGKQRTARVILLWLQPLLCIGAAWLIYLRTILEEPWTGAWLAWTALSAYFLASVYTAGADVYASVKRKRGPAPASG